MPPQKTGLCGTHLSCFCVHLVPYIDNAVLHRYMLHKAISPHARYPPLHASSWRDFSQNYCWKRGLNNALIRVRCDCRSTLTVCICVAGWPMLEIGLRSVWAQHVWTTMTGSNMLQQCAPCASGPHGTAIVQTPSLALEQMSLLCMTVNSPNTSHMISNCLIWIRILTIGLHARCVIRPFRK